MSDLFSHFHVDWCRQAVIGVLGIAIDVGVEIIFSDANVHKLKVAWKVNDAVRGSQHVTIVDETATAVVLERFSLDCLMEN